MGNNPVYADVYVDGNYVGTGPHVSTTVDAGYHSITVQDPAWDPTRGSYATFSYVEDQNYNWYGNPGYVQSMTTQRFMHSTG